MPFQEQYRDHFTTAVYRQESFFSSVLLVLPRENFSFPSDHTSMTYTMLLCVIMAWLYIKLTRKTTPDEPTGDPVDSDPTRYIRPCWTDGLIPTGFCFPHLKLWPFSPVLPVQVKHSRNHAYPRCGLWPRTTVCHLRHFLVKAPIWTSSHMEMDYCPLD